MADQLHQLNNTFSKISILYEMVKEDPEQEEYIKSLKKELELIEELFQSLRCNS